MSLKFRFLTGDMNWRDYGGSWVSKRLNNGEFDYWLVIRFTNLDDAMGDDAPAKYDVSLCAVSPQEAGAEELKRAYGSTGMLDSDIPNPDILDDPLTQVLALSEYGVYATLWNDCGNNANELLKAARYQAMLSQAFTFGFMMDKYQNRVGATGWDFIKGNIYPSATQ